MSGEIETRRVRGWVARGLAAALVAWGALPGAAAAGEAEDLRRVVADLEQRLAQLERRADGAEAESLAGWDHGFRLRSRDGAFQLRIGGYFQTDGRFFPDDPDEERDDTFLMRRVRTDLRGTLLETVDFRILADLADSDLDLLDAYVDARFDPAARIRIGKGKVPFGIERLQSSAALRFVERGLTDNLVPNRDIGVTLHGDLLAKRLGYAVGVFNGVRDGRSGERSGRDAKDVVARVFAHPFRESGLAPLEGLGLGIAASAGRQDGDNDGLPVFRTSGRQNFFRYRAAVEPDGQRWRLSPQLYHYWGPLGLLGELVLSAQDVALPGGDSESLQNVAWQAAGSWVLTGENASHRGVTPERPFVPGRGGLGAFELGVRLSRLDIDDDAFPVFADPATQAEEATSWTVGLNWYWNAWMKLVLNYEETLFDGGEGNGDRDTERAVLTRFQIAF